MFFSVQVQAVHGRLSRRVSARIINNSLNVQGAADDKTFNFRNYANCIVRSNSVEGDASASDIITREIIFFN